MIESTDMHPTDYTQGGHKVSNSTRMQVKVANSTKDALIPVYRANPRKTASYIVEIAEGLGLLEALRLLSEENRSGGVGQKVVWVTPTRVLIDKAARYYVGPQVLVRAAAVKIAKEMEAGGVID